MKPLHISVLTRSLTRPSKTKSGLFLSNPDDIKTKAEHPIRWARVLDFGPEVVGLTKGDFVYLPYGIGAMSNVDYKDIQYTIISDYKTLTVVHNGEISELGDYIDYE